MAKPEGLPYCQGLSLWERWHGVSRDGEGEAVYKYRKEQFPWGLRYRLTPGKRTVPDPDSGADATKEEKILTVDYWPAPWTIDKTDPALRRREVFPLTDEGRAAAAQYLKDAYDAEPERWNNCPDMMDCDPWEPPAEPDTANE